MPGTPPPLVLRPLPVGRPWGGRSAHALLDLVAPTSDEPIGEWWLVSARAERESIVANAPYEGRKIGAVLSEQRDAILGAAGARRDRFPLLIKLLDTVAPLSVQVHPSELALPGEGKTETWYVLQADPGASLWAGLADGVGLDRFFATVERGGDPLPLLARHAARAGDIVHLHAGLIHALGAGIVALEVQTSADTTYRIHDHGRLPARELHLERARAVASADQRAAFPRPQPLPPASPPHDLLAACDDYRIERLRLTAPSQFATQGERFEILLPLGAALHFAGEGGSAEVPRGHALLVPAGTSEFVVTPAAPLDLLRILPGHEETS
jgi:mannose-6-phosphate isomerase